MSNFTLDRNGFLYGFSRGFSMWPALIPGDILRGVFVHAGELRPGDIVVLNHMTRQPVVHRVRRISRGDNGRLMVETGGDRSGADPLSWMDGADSVLRVEGILRGREWIPAGRRMPGSRFVPVWIVRLHCRMVRIRQW